MKTLEEKQAAMRERAAKMREARAQRRAINAAIEAQKHQTNTIPATASPDALPDEKEALAALWNRAQSGKQGAGQAYKTYLEYLVGKAHSKPQVPTGPSLPEETAKRIADVAERLTAKCPHCGEILAAAPAVSKPGNSVSNLTHSPEGAPALT